MKLWKYTFPSILGASVLAGGLYFITDTELKHEWVKIIADTVTHRTQNTISPFWDTKIYWIPSEIILPISNSQTKDSIDELLQKNPTLKQRIQGTIWYREYLTGELDKSIVEKYILDAYSIEEKLRQNPWIREKIQYEWWWQRYLRGDTNPTDMLAGNIQALITLQKIEQEQPEIYNLAQKSPLWNRGIQQWEDYIVTGQTELITSLTLRIKQLDENPKIEEQLKKSWFSRENLFTDDWSQSQGIYSVIDIVREINELNMERKEEFFSSNLWKEYLSGKVNSSAIERYLHGE